MKKDPMCFHECPNCNMRCNCDDQPCSCCNGAGEFDFQKKCPKLYGAIKNNQRQYEVYGIKFKSHTELTWHDIISKESDSFRLYYFKSFGEENYRNKQPGLVCLN